MKVGGRFVMFCLAQWPITFSIMSSVLYCCFDLSTTTAAKQCGDGRKQEISLLNKVFSGFYPSFPPTVFHRQMFAGFFCLAITDKGTAAFIRLNWCSSLTTWYGVFLYDMVRTVLHEKKLTLKSEMSKYLMLIPIPLCTL